MLIKICYGQNIQVRGKERSLSSNKACPTPPRHHQVTAEKDLLGREELQGTERTELRKGGVMRILPKKLPKSSLKSSAWLNTQSGFL